MMGASAGHGYFDVLSTRSVAFSANSGAMLNGDMRANGWQQ
ncbi:TPA: hypothetical protein ACJ5GP_000441 [Yersinia enterocolitica]|nr:hypothetical protein [Yersinia enterocolitica]